MPCHSYSIPAIECKTGSKLAKVPGTVCFKCYARKGRYVFGSVKAALARRFKSLKRPKWVEAMVVLITAAGEEFFRWHDSGDVQSVAHLRNIFKVAKRTVLTRHWLPTKEFAIVKKAGPPPGNLVIRLSAHKVDTMPPPNVIGSMVYSDRSKVPEGVFFCEAKSRDNKCAPCRACWDPAVRVVAYPQH
jgi:hypothetical protein